MKLLTLKRLFDIGLALILTVLFSPLILLIIVLIKIDDPGPAIHWSKRVGINNGLFLMPKFRTMKLNTPQVATHLMSNSQNFLTRLGGFLRKSSLDELPQLWSVLKGDMSFVGPRPALFNQDDLVELRTTKGIHTLVPGITGWAQINGRDSAPIPHKVELDHHYLKNQSFFFDIKIMVKTFTNVITSKDISH